MPNSATSSSAGSHRRAAATVSAPRRRATDGAGIGIPASMDTGGSYFICRTRGDTSAQFRSKLFGDDMGVRAVADDLRPDEDNQLGACRGVVLVPEGVAETGNRIEQRNPAARAVLLFADQSRQQHRLPGRHRNRALDLSFRYGRRQA